MAAFNQIRYSHFRIRLSAFTVPINQQDVGPGSLCAPLDDSDDEYDLDDTNDDEDIIEV